MTRVDFVPCTVALLVALGCGGGKQNDRDGGDPSGLPGDEGGIPPDAGGSDLAPIDAAVTPTDALPAPGGVTIRPTGSPPVSSSNPGLQLHARLYSDTEVVRDSWPPSTTRTPRNGAAVEVWHGCAEYPAIGQVVITTCAEDPLGACFWLRLGSSAPVTGRYRHLGEPQLDCQVLDGEVIMSLAEYPIPPAEDGGPPQDLAVGSFDVPCWMPDDAGALTRSLTLRGWFELPVERNVLACAP